MRREENTIERTDHHDAVYPPAHWRLLVTGFQDGASNMALDEAILRAVIEGVAPATLRFYGWEPPCVSIGYSQSLEDEIDLERCRQDGVMWVRRPTGGRAILHIDELTYSVALLQDDPRALGGIVESYRHLSRGLVAGLQELGLHVVQAAYQNTKGIHTSAACFDVPSHYEITVNGHKLVGSAQMRRLGGVLQHGTLPLYGDIGRLANYLRLPSEQERSRLRDTLRRRAITLCNALGRQVRFTEAVEALAAGFSRALNITLMAGELTVQEQMWLHALRAEKYANPEWLAGRPRGCP